MMITDRNVIAKITDSKVEQVVKSIKNHPYTCAVFYDSKYYLAYSDEVEQGNKYMLVYDWNMNNFVRYTGIYTYELLVTLDNKLRAATTNYIAQFNVDAYNDINILNGELKPINIKVETKSFNFGSPIHQKLFHRLFVTSSQNVDKGNVFNLRLRIDYSTIAYLDLDLNAEMFIWGISQWGGVWGSADMVTQETNIRRKGVRSKICFEANTINTINSVVVYGIAFEVDYSVARARKIQGVMK
jgi:hypothetical protein